MFGYGKVAMMFQYFAVMFPAHISYLYIVFLHILLLSYVNMVNLQAAITF